MEIKDGITINIKAKFEVDQDTVATCINLINLYGRSKGLEGMVLQFSDDGCQVEEVADKYAMDEIMYRAVELR